MNTKAQAPATNAPTAKDENKAGNVGTSNAKAANTAKFIPMTAEEQKEYNDLKHRFHDLDDKEEARLIELKKKFKAAEASKGSYINQLKNEIGQSGLTISDLFGPNEAAKGYEFKDLFTADELKAAIMKAGYDLKDLFSNEAIKAAAGVKTGKGSKGQDTQTTSSEDKGELWIKIEGRGAPSYYKGQLYKKLTAKQKENKDYSKALGVAALPKNWMANDSIEALMKSATPKAKELFEQKDKEFMAEMEDLVKAIHSHKDYIAAKGTSGTGKQAA